MKDLVYREIVSILMSSEFYFDLSIEERHALVRHLMKSSALSAESLISATRFVDISPTGTA